MKKFILIISLLFMAPSIHAGEYIGMGVVAGTMGACAALKENDKRMHCAIGAGASLLTGMIVQEKDLRYWLPMVVGCGLGIGKEVIDHNTKGNKGDPKDAGATCLPSITITYGLNRIITHYNNNSIKVEYVTAFNLLE